MLAECRQRKRNL